MEISILLYQDFILFYSCIKLQCPKVLPSAVSQSTAVCSVPKYCRLQCPKVLPLRLFPPMPMLEFEKRVIK